MGFRFLLDNKKTSGEKIKMKSFRTLKKNAKALSPVVASIILIAVTVAVSVVVAAWMGGMSIGLMGNAEQAAITNVEFKTVNSVNATVINTGSDSITISSATVDGSSSAITRSGADTASGMTLAKGQTGYFQIVTTVTFTTSAGYDFKLMTAKGNAIVYTATYAP